MPYLDGSNQIAAVADTGLGGGTSHGASSMFRPLRIAGIFNWRASLPIVAVITITNDGAIDVDNGYGRMSHSVVGDGDAARMEKVQPAAGLVFRPRNVSSPSPTSAAFLYGLTIDFT